MADMMGGMMGGMGDILGSGKLCKRDGSWRTFTKCTDRDEPARISWRSTTGFGTGCTHAKAADVTIAVAGKRRKRSCRR
jgi:hypothetical protein